LIVLFAKVAGDGFQSGGGAPANRVFGATQDLLTHDQKKATEVVIRNQAGDQEEAKTSGEPVDQNNEGRK